MSFSTDKGAKGVLTNETFVGCIRNLHLNDRLQYLASGISTGDVRHGYCPIAWPDTTLILVV